MSTDNQIGTTEIDFETNVLWNRFQDIAEEMYDVTCRQAFSIVMSEWTDASSVVMTRDGDAVGMSKRSVPVLSGCIPRMTRILLDEYYPLSELKPDDAIITNDPWIGGGHLPDTGILEPVYHEGEVVALVASLGNLQDIGGSPGMWAGDAQEFYEEGLYIPPSKYYQEGEKNESLEGVIRGNVRFPDQVEGDLEALHTANRVGVRRVQEVINEYGLDTFKEVTDSILQLSEDAMRAELDQIEDGSYQSDVSYTVGDDEFVETFDLELKVEITIDGSAIHVDFSGSSEQVPAGVNCPMPSTRGMTCYPLQSMTLPDINGADGLYEPLEITAPEGTVVNPTKPAACDSRHLVFYPLAGIVYEALSKAMPERGVAFPGVHQLHLFMGMDEQGQQFYIPNLSTGTMPARANKDGHSSALFPDNARTVPVEIFEQYSPIRFEEHSLVPDSEGPGEYRSGFADRTVFTNPLDHEVNLTVVTTASSEPRGFKGGHAGQLGVAESLNSDSAVPTHGRTMMEPGERFGFQTATSGGYGDPSDRDPELIERDIELGLISEERATDVYGYEG